VPLPSLARTEALDKAIDAVPFCFAFKLTVIILITFLIIAGMIAAISISMATPPKPAGPPDLPPPSSGSSGSSGGSSSGGSSVSTFTPYVVNLLNSNGTVIGTLTGKSATSVLLWASNNSTIGGKNYTLTMEAELTQKPTDDARLDITPGGLNSSGLPAGMNDVTVLGMVNIVKHAPYGWNVKGETVKLTFNVPGTPGSDPDTIYYLVRYDGSSYNIQKATLKSSDAGMMTFEVSPGTDNGQFTLVMVGSAVPTPTPMPSLTPTPAAVSSPTPTSSDGTTGISGFGLYLVMGIMGLLLVVALALFYLLYIKR